MLGVVGLTQRRATLIRHLSGGQVKRASLAKEMICKPTLLFLDEVTSGLDEQTDRDMMDLFRQVADDGKTVVCITHNLANVEATCHLVAILTEGGRLAFFGPPEAAKNSVPLTSVSHPGKDDSPPGLMSRRRNVPAAVPSLRQSSRPAPPSAAEK